MSLSIKRFNRLLDKADDKAGVPERWASPKTEAGKALRRVVRHESGYAADGGYKPRAQNDSSSAFGLFQFLDSTWAGTGVKKAWAKEGHNGKPAAFWQMVAGFRYIEARYGSPGAANSHQRSHGWY